MWLWCDSECNSGDSNVALNVRKFHVSLPLKRRLRLTVPLGVAFLRPQVNPSCFLPTREQTFCLFVIFARAFWKRFWARSWSLWIVNIVCDTAVCALLCVRRGFSWVLFRFFYKWTREVLRSCFPYLWWRVRRWFSLLYIWIFLIGRHKRFMKMSVWFLIQNRQFVNPRLLIP